MPNDEMTYQNNSIQNVHIHFCMYNDSWQQYLHTLRFFLGKGNDHTHLHLKKYSCLN